MPAKEELPSTLQTLAEKGPGHVVQGPRLGGREYGEGERAHRTAFAALKHSFEKVGDHWEPKAQEGPPTRRPPAAPSSRKPGRPPAAWTPTPVQGPSDGCCQAAGHPRPVAG